MAICRENSSNIAPEKRIDLLVPLLNRYLGGMGLRKDRHAQVETHDSGEMGRGIEPADQTDRSVSL